MLNSSLGDKSVGDSNLPNLNTCISICATDGFSNVECLYDYPDIENDTKIELTVNHEMPNYYTSLVQEASTYLKWLLTPSHLPAALVEL